jgi:hypothetical protein
MQGRRSTDRTGQYAVSEYAAKYNLTDKTARVLLTLHGPSRRACDAAAIAFNKAVSQRLAGTLTDRLEID